MELLEECIDGVEKCFSVIGIGDDSVDHLMMTVHHLLEACAPLILAADGES